MATESKNILLIVGDDEYMIDANTKRIIEKHVPKDYRSSAVEIVSGTAPNAESQLASIRECLASIQTPPFLDPIKLTLWKNVTFLPGGGRGGRISEDVKKALEQFADSLAKTPIPSNQFLVVSASKLDKASIFAKRMKTIADIIYHEIPKRSRDRTTAALAQLPSLAESENLSFEVGADSAFIAKTGPDIRTIISELAKMRTYLGEGNRKVTAKDVAAITSAGGDDVEIWELTDALATRNAGKTLAALRNFQGDSNWPMLISTVTEHWFRDLIIAKADGGDDSWPWRKKKSAAAGFTMTELRMGRYRMIALREKLVSSQPTSEYVEMEILRTVSR